MIRSFDGKTPIVPESAFVSEAAYVIGDVELSENAGIWPGAVVRADFAKIKIGVNSNIEDNCVLHTPVLMEIGDNVLLGHGVIMHGRRIGNNSLIGNNATILDDAEIGECCVVGAGCVVSQGMRVPDNSLVVGVPAQVKRQISPEMREMLRTGPIAYVKLARRYKEQGL